MIRGDKWLPDLHLSWVVSPQKNLPNNARVYALIDEENGRWIEDRIQNEFVPHEAAAILGLPLSSTHVEDRLIWTATSNGVYSTKSAYQLLSKEAEVKAPGPSNLADNKQFWLDIWALNLPNKIRHFLWRAAIDSLPTKLNLMNRNITANSLCDGCGCETEDTIHALWDCIEVKNVWWKLVRCRPFLTEKLVCCRDLCQGILALKSPHLVETFAYIAYGIWHNRNTQRMGAVTLPLGKIYTDAVERLQEFHAAQDIPVQQRMMDHPAHWLPPPPTQFKANSDGAIF